MILRSPAEHEQEAQPPKIARARPIQQQLLVQKKKTDKRNYDKRKIGPWRKVPWRKIQMSKIPQDQVEENFSAPFLSLKSLHDT